MLGYDGTSMDLDRGDNVVQKREVIICCVRAYQSDGTSLELAPSLKVAVSLDAFGLITSLNTEDWKLNAFAQGTPRWKSVIVVCDNAVIDECKLAFGNTFVK